MKLIAILALAATLGAQTHDGNGALERFYARKPEKTWYWYSPLQESQMRELADTHDLRYFYKTVSVKGVNRAYTEITHTNKPSGYWPDYKLVAVK